MEFYIDLYKAVMNFAKLVKKPVQVRGKNGQVFTRMQWVSPEEASTGHGIRRINSPEGLKRAKEDGIDKHPHFHESMKEQGVDPEHFDKTHPHFFLPETEDSANNWFKRTKVSSLNRQSHAQAAQEKEHHHHTMHNAKPINHNVITEHSSYLSEETEQFLRRHNIHPEIHHLVKNYIEPHSQRNDHIDISKRLEFLSDTLKEHKATIHNHVAEHIKDTTKDTFVRNVQLGALKEGRMHLLALHPHIAKETINSFLGKDLADKFRKDLDIANLSVNFPGKHTESIAEKGYFADTMMKYIERNMGEEGVEKMERHIEDDSFSSESERIDAILDFGGWGDSPWQDVHQRAEAEHKALGLTLEDRKPTYIAFNYDARETGGAVYYGNRHFTINEDRVDHVLNHSTATMDDTFETAWSIAKIFSMDHLKDMYILKAMEKHPSMKYIVQNGEDDENYGMWSMYKGEIPLEVQYHEPKLDAHEFTIMPDPANKPKEEEDEHDDIDYDDFEDLDLDDIGDLDFDEDDDLDFDFDDLEDEPTSRESTDFNPDDMGDLSLDADVSWEKLLNENEPVKGSKEYYNDHYKGISSFHPKIQEAGLSQAEKFAFIDAHKKGMYLGDWLEKNKPEVLKSK